MSPKMLKVISENNIKDIHVYLFEEYWNKNKSAEQIGKQLNIDRRLVIDWMKKLNIKRRGNTEKVQTINAENLIPNFKQWQMILGLWLGDGNIRLVKGGINAQQRLTHGEKQYEYLKYKQKILEENKLLHFKEYKRKGGGFGGDNCIRYSLESQCTPLLNGIHKDCYMSGKANFNKNYLYQIDDYGLFIWYLDDGSLQQNNHIILCTDNFTYEDNLQIQEYFKLKYNIGTIIFSTRKDQFRLRLNQVNTLKFFHIINKYKEEVPCMKYKFLSKERK